MSEKEKLYPIIVPDNLMPLRTPGMSIEEECACKRKPVDLKKERGIFHWSVEVGDEIEAGDTVGEGEVSKRTIEIIAPCDGILVEQCIEELEVFEAGTIIGYIKKNL